MLRLAGLYVLADAMMVVFSGALRGAGDTFWTMCISVGLHWLLLPVLFITLKILQLSPQTAWLALVILFLSFSGVFYLRYRSGHWKTLTVVGEADRVAGIRRRGFRILPQSARQDRPESVPAQYPLRRPDAARPGAGDAARGAGAVADHEDVAAHPEVTVEEDGLVGVHLDLRIVHDGARVEDAGDDGVELLQRRQMWRMILAGTASPRSPAVTG